MKHVELDLVRDLVLPLMGVVLVCLHNLLIVPERKQARDKMLQLPYQPRKNNRITIYIPLPGRGFLESFWDIVSARTCF